MFIPFFCENCDTLLNERKFFVISRVEIIAQEGIKEMKIDKFVEELEKWAFSKYYHASASQIVLFRPDVVTEFIKEKEGETASWFVKPIYLCEKCYEKWKIKHPVR